LSDLLSNPPENTPTNPGDKPKEAIIIADSGEVCILFNPYIVNLTHLQKHSFPLIQK
jgi:hypothetical protein